MSLPERIQTTPRYLLLLACSQRKRTDSTPLPAIERYTGVNFQVLHKAQREGYLPENLDILILSAKYGLLEAKSPIDYYDLKMTSSRAKELQANTSQQLDLILSQTTYKEIFINFGKTYLTAFNSSAMLPQLEQRVIYAAGGIGQKMAQMKEWLYNISKNG